MIKALFIDAGHGLGPTGAIDNGTSGHGTTERTEVVELAQSLAATLAIDASFAGVQVIKVGVDERLMLKDHIRIINTLCTQNGWNAADTLLLSLHLNAAASTAARGLEAWYSPNEPGMFAFGTLLVEQVSAATGMPPRARPVLTTAENRHGRLGIIDDTIARGCLFEAGFLSNPSDAAFFTNNALQATVVQGLHRAIRAFLALPSSSVPTVPPDFYIDVPSSAWYHDDVALCLQEGLLRMPADGRFHPERPVTRADMAAVLARHLRSRHNDA